MGYALFGVSHFYCFKEVISSMSCRGAPRAFMEKIQLNSEGTCVSR
ncbi:hypothetical protein CBB_2498 [Clostridium botulinum Bf]|uniref:Uncharacterized protein n=1 Tax=Clostridium botulinum (strain 657 / Type Ba4) TaxID=515621 RepID=A0A3F2ZS56_CLOB6|nr:hypothetical protein CLJ_B2465 [Clostridium botulinum Ba4 str. 657]EDT84939.1 hypothetical protein CBB_2498 [Clostridium botulinum Bf]